MRGKTFIILSVLAFLPVAACIFGPARFKGVMGYRSDGRVFIQHDKYYRVGVLPDGWGRMDTKARTISFYEPDLKASISTDVFCGRDVSDRSIGSLGGDIITALENRSVMNTEKFDLDGRGAIREKVSGKLDGVPVVVDLVVVRKNGCVFDMYSVTPPLANPEVAQDFEGFFGGFHYE